MAYACSQSARPFDSARAPGRRRTTRGVDDFVLDQLEITLSPNENTSHNKYRSCAMLCRACHRQKDDSVMNLNLPRVYRITLNSYFYEL